MNKPLGAGKSKPGPNLTVITSGIILLYSLLFFPICPSPTLAFAITLELAAFLLIAVPLRGGGLPLFAWPEKALNWVCEKLPVLTRVRNGWRKLTILIAFTMICGAAIDLAAVWMAATGFTQGAISLYSALPVSYLLGGHPAFSLEMLTGACVESHQYERAEGLYKAVLEVRKNVYGPTHPMVAALYADLGDLNQKMNRPEEAQLWYKASMALNEGQGRAAHRMANLLRDEGNTAESEGFYKRALTLRARFFGTGSAKYQATWDDYQSAMAKDSLKKTDVTR
jgi:tetratricopeptide (TPR) repeat protein